MAPIKFGTSGWRAIMAEEFTFRNVEIVTQAIAEVVRAETPSEPAVVIGYDGRFLADRFARTVALTLVDAGIKVYLPHRPVPTPVVAYLIRSRGLSGGIVLTASHNPPEYNGLKFSPSNGAPAPPELTRRIETRANALLAEAGPETRFPVVAVAQTELLEAAARDGRIEWYDPYSEYRNHLFELLNVDALRNARLHVVTDAFYGAGRGYLAELLQELGCEVASLHEEANPLFGGTRPDPIAENVHELAEQVRNSEAVLGLAVDGDADRFGIVDEDGSYVHANFILALLLDYLVESRGWRGEVVRSAPTSHLVDAVARYHGIDVVETPTGFKFIGGRFVESPETFVLGGEESNGLTIHGHIPEKDGILACLLVAEMVAAKGESVTACLSALFARVGERVVDRLDLELTEERKAALLTELAEDPPKEIGGITVERVETLDGFKFVLENGGFVAVRASGTEPLVRCYLDAPSREAMQQMAEGARELVGT